MKQLLVFVSAIFALSCSQIPKKKIAARQEMIDAYIKKYQNRLNSAPDSASKKEVLYRMWSKHIRFIQDTLRFTFYPVRTVDTFYFEKIYIKQDTLIDGIEIEVLLQSEMYDARMGYFFPKNQNPKYDPHYQMLTKLKTDEPVYAVIYIQDFSFNLNLLPNGTIRPIFRGIIDKIFNPD